MKNLPKHARQTDKFLSKFKGLKVGIFVDNSNLFYAQKENGWKIDYQKLKELLSKFLKISVFNFYAAVPKKSDPSYKSTINYLNQIKKCANLKTKPLKYIRDGNRIRKKGDVDLEIAIDTVRNIKNIDLVIVASGDSDYLELKNWVIRDNKKKILFMGFESNTSWEIRQCWHIYFDRIKGEVSLKKQAPTKRSG